MIGKKFILVIVSLLISAASVKKVDSGFHGNTWIQKNEADNLTYIMKESKLDIGLDITIRREMYFGQKLSTANSTTGKDNVARFVKHMKKGKKIQLAFIYEGAPLGKLLFHFDANEKTFEPTAWLTWLRNTTEGQQVMKNLFHQMLLGVKFCHDNGVIHRDIKLDNMVICFEKTNGSCGMNTPLHTNDVHLKIIDFGSAVDNFARQNLYGENGPGWEQQDMLTMPPEAIIDQLSWGTYSLTPKYDSWSIGHTMLEFILGIRDVFCFEHYDSLELVRNYQPDEDFDVTTARLAGMAEHCIGLSDAVDVEKMKKFATCTDDGYADYIRSRTSLLLFVDIELLNLARLLLEADPNLRIGVDEALGHPYFADLIGVDHPYFAVPIGVDEALPHPYFAVPIGVDETYSTDISLSYCVIVLAFMLMVTCICCGLKRKSKKE